MCLHVSFSWGKNLALIKNTFVCMLYQLQVAGERVTIANSFDGITIYHAKREDILSWKDVLKISYKKNAFAIKHKVN